MPDVPVTLDLIEDLFCQVLEAAVGVPVYVDGKMGPQPPKQYCTIGITSIDPAQNEISTFVENEDGSITEHLRGESYCALSIAFWGNGAMGKALSAHLSIQSHARWFDLWRILGYSGADPVQDTTTAFLGKMQERTAFRIYFYAPLGTLFPADYFTSSQWTISLPPQNYDGDTVLPYTGD